jgi:hypothetical protein
MSTRELRDEILASVRRGKMSTQSAEDWAAENGEIFSTKPDPARFDPMTESHWTLPMAAAWIIERSDEDVRDQWDMYRRECLQWEFLGPPGFGAELRAVGPANLDVFRHVDPFEDDIRPFAREICFALRSGQLSATGVRRGRKMRVPISELAWHGPFHGTERATRPDTIYAADFEAIRHDERVYSEVQVPRDQVIGIWPPLAPAFIRSSTRVGAPIPSVKLAATLPSGFDRPDWSTEHVLAWLAHPKLAELRTLELAKPDRPEFYGRTYRRGFIDARLGEILRGALITEKLIAMKGENPVRRRGYWRDKCVWNSQRIWFRSDHVMQIWPEGGSESAQATETGFHSEGVSTSSGERGARKQDRADRGEPVPKVAKRVNKPEDIARWLKAHFGIRPSLSIANFRKEMKRDGKEQLATASDSTFRRAFRLAWPAK